MLKTTSFKLDSELLKQIKIRATEKEITQSELITKYLIMGLKQDKNVNSIDIDELEKLLNIKHGNHLDDIEFNIPKSLEYDPDKVNKSIKDEPIELENDKPDGEDIFKDIIGIVKGPAETD
jgi:hypothetical protein